VTKVSVILKKDGNSLQLTVQDNGRGFIQPNNGRGLGLNQMADRVTAVGGTFHIESHSGSGTAVVSRLPLPGTRNG